MAALNHPHEPREIGSLIIGGRDVTCAFNSATWTTTKNETDVSGVCREGAFNQTTGIQGTLSGEFYGASANAFVTNNLDFTALTVGGVDIMPQTYSMQFSGSFTKANLPGNTAGMAAGVLRRDFSGSLEMVLDDNATVQALVVAAESMDFSDYEVALSFTLLGKVYTLPIKLGTVSHPITVGDYQKVTVTFSGQAPARGTAYPTAPTTLPGTPGILDYAVLSPRSNLAFTFLSNTVQGLRRTGYLTWDSFSFGLNDRAVTMFSYSLSTFGNFLTEIAAEP